MLGAIMKYLNNIVTWLRHVIPAHKQDF